MGQVQGQQRLCFRLRKRQEEKCLGYSEQLQAWFLCITVSTFCCVFCSQLDLVLGQIPDTIILGHLFPLMETHQRLEEAWVHYVGDSGCRLNFRVIIVVKSSDPS